MEKGLDGVKPSVATRYLSSIRNFDSLFGDLLLEKITTKDVAEWVNWRKDTGRRTPYHDTESKRYDVSNATI